MGLITTNCIIHVTHFNFVQQIETLHSKENNLCNITLEHRYVKPLDINGERIGLPEKCTENQCTCDNGVGATGTDCPTHGDAKCTSCDDGYHLADAYTAYPTQGPTCVLKECKWCSCAKR